MHISSRCSVAIHCLVFIRCYGQSQKVTSELLARSAGVNPVTVRNILSALKKEGILAVRPGTGGATLCCPPEEVTLYRICRAIEPDFLDRLIGVHPAPSQHCPVGRGIHRVLDSCYGRVRGELRQSLQRISLAEILQDYRDLPQGG